MKGQLTLEYLFLALISLVLIAISFAALGKISEAGARAYSLGLFKTSFSDIHNAGEELCAMGAGNSMTLKIKQNISIFYDSDKKKTIFSNKNLNVSVSVQTTCPYYPVDVSANSIIEIKNENSEIKISKIE